MTPVVLLVAGLAALVGAWLVLRSIGPGYRVGRLLATTPRASVEEAVAVAMAGRSQYLRVDGRIDAEDEFEDADHRPLVFRRTRFQARRRAGWVTVDDAREAIPFTVREGLTEVGIDVGALGEGLVVMPRESVGTASDVPDRVPKTLDPGTPVRALIEQISSVEHAIVLGVPVATADGPRMTAGLGRPLVLTTLEPPEAMRILAADTPGRPRLAAALLAVAAILVTLAITLWIAGFVVPASAAAASPSPAAGGDPRSSGEGPGLVGEPMLAIAGVLAIGVASVLLTWLYVRATRGAAARERADRR